MRAGNERILAFLGPGAVVGELSIIDGRARSASAVAVRDSALSFLGRAAFEEFAQKHPEVYKSLVRLLATRLRETDNVVAAGSFLPLRGRVAFTLLELARYFGQDVGSGRVLIRQKIGQSDLAAMTNHRNRDGLVVACRSARAALKRTAARGCSNFNDLRKAAAGRVVTTLEFYKGPFCCGPAI